MSVDGLQEYIENAYEQLEEHVLILHHLTNVIIKPSEPLKDDRINEIYEIAKKYCNQWEKLKELL